MSMDVEERERAFAYWREWLKLNRGDLATLRTMIRGFRTATQALARADEDEVKLRFTNFKVAVGAVQRCLDRIETHAWLSEYYKAPRASQLGTPGARVEARDRPETDLYYLTAWLSENFLGFNDALAAARTLDEQLDFLDRITPGKLSMRSAQFAEAIEDLRFQLGRINPAGWIVERVP